LYPETKCTEPTREIPINEYKSVFDTKRPKAEKPKIIM